MYFRSIGKDGKEEIIRPAVKPNSVENYEPSNSTSSNVDGMPWWKWVLIVVAVVVALVIIYLVAGLSDVTSQLMFS